jgi:hypothetical protein
LNNLAGAGVLVPIAHADALTSCISDGEPDSLSACAISVTPTIRGAEDAASYDPRARAVMGRLQGIIDQMNRGSGSGARAALDQICDELERPR